ncbi:hypothetical protein Nepgr_023068 [Nepenthes gracilis]|uniref:Uncharacterized protein n=1 Tax=Nepenthes gracilis TaxID=150966 RepID=A0AAD3XZ06_NEPGR|nr:hypothetical protein Nepgr_023068 [Nepenthes gracilis]
MAVDLQHKEATGICLVTFHQHPRSKSEPDLQVATTVSIYSQSSSQLQLHMGLKHVSKPAPAYSIFSRATSAAQPDPATAPRWHSNISKLPMEQKQQGNSSHVDHQGSRNHKKDPHCKQHAPLQRHQASAVAASSRGPTRSA